MTHEYQSREKRNCLHDPDALSSPNSDFEDPGLLKGNVVAVESGPPPEFRPVLEGRLFAAHDSIIEANYEVHPTARLLYDSLPQEYRDVFKNCTMYLEKHLEFVKYLRYLSLNDLDKKNEPSSERDLIKSLGIPVSTEEGDKKKWQCGVVGCEYKGTLQHLVSHLRAKSHIGIATFVCNLDCKMLFHHSQDRDRHVKGKTCLRPRLVDDAAEPQGSARSLRGVRDQVVPATKPKNKSRANQHLDREREYQISAQPSAQGVNDPRTRKAAQYDPRFQAPGNGGHYNPGMPPTSFAPPQPSGSSVHLTHAYHQNNSNVPTTQDGHAGLHPVFHAPVTPDFFPTILPINNGGMHATVITNNNHIHSTTGNFQPTGNPQFTLGSQPVNPDFNHLTGLTSAYPGFDPRVNTGYRGPGQLSAPYSANSAGNFYGEEPPQPPPDRPPTSFAPPKPFVIPVHLTLAYHQTHSNVPTAQDGRVGMHTPSRALLTPDLFRTPSILPTNYGGVTVITNNNHIHSTAGSSQPTNNLQSTPALQPVDTGFDHSTGPTYGHLHFDPRMATRYQDPGQSSTSNFANITGNFYGNDPPEGSHRRPHDSRQPPPYQGHSFRRDEDEVYNTRDHHQPRGPPGPPAGRRH